jgi:hypothetical protein
VGLVALGTVLLAFSAMVADARPWAVAAAVRFVDTIAYQQRVLNPSGAAFATTVAHSRLSTGGALLDLLSVATAVILVARGRRRATQRTVRRRRWSPWAAMRRLHDGSIGDSATWATIGTATIAIILATSLR